MTHRLLEFHTEAADEVESAMGWYSLKSPAAARQLMAELDEALARIAEAPDRWPEHLHGTRRYLLKRFPFLIIYRVRSDRIQIVACAHGRRRPAYWRDRFESK